MIYETFSTHKEQLMKKRMISITGMLLFATGFAAFAQEPAPPPPPPPPPPPVEKKTEEIIIKKKGDKEANLTIQINGDQVLVNGKPMMEFNEDGITVNKRKIIVRDGDKFIIGDNPDNQVIMDMPDNFAWNSGEKRTFLGVVTAADKDGALIEDVTAESPAAKAGLEKGDIITKVGDDKISTPDDLSKSIRARKANEEVKISYLHNGKKKSTKATLSEKEGSAKVFGFSGPKGQYRQLVIPPGGQDQFRFNQDMFNDIQRGEGFFNQDENGNMNGNFNFDFATPRKKLGLKIQDTEDETGVKVLEVEDSSAAQTAGLKKDDVIIEIAGSKVSNTDVARELLSANREKSLYNIKAKRNGKEMSFDIKIPKKLKTANL